LLAAGLGTRLRPITDTVPKCMVPIMGRPLIDLWFDLLLGQGIERVLINTHYMADLVEAHVKGSHWAGRIDIFHEESLLGTGGTVLANVDYFGDESFIVAHADNLTQFDVGTFTARHDLRPSGVHITMMTFVTDVPKSCGIVELDKNGVVVGFYEKSEDFHGNLANGAVYIFDETVVDYMHMLKRPVFDLSTDVIPNFIGRMQTYPTDGFLIDVGTPSQLEKAQELMQEWQR